MIGRSHEVSMLDRPKSVRHNPENIHISLICFQEELEEFFRREFIVRGLCNVDETPVKKIKFIANRHYQFVVVSSHKFDECGQH